MRGAPAFCENSREDKKTRRHDGRRCLRLLIIYDIPDDRARTRVADACLDYGLERIQYSAFVGALSRVHQRELLLKVGRLLAHEPAKVRFIPLDERSWEQQRIIERPARGERLEPHHAT